MAAGATEKRAPVQVLVIGDLGRGRRGYDRCGLCSQGAQLGQQHHHSSAALGYRRSGKVWQHDQSVYKEAVGAFVVFDVTRLATFEAVPTWKKDLDNKVLLPQR
eukprot:Em0005g1608a